MKKQVYRTPDFFVSELYEESLLCQSRTTSAEEFGPDNDFNMF